ncbi:MAG: radical SAM protein, partial [Oscillospiraceae bacterium]|nr:radical SAM protein [Oscillospiraceae bacterium]
MENVLRRTRSVCPVCLKNIPARLVRGGDGAIVMEKSCPEHGGFSVTVWQGLMDFELWTRGGEPLPDGGGVGCPRDCGLCGEHEAETCCALLEVTSRCDLRCRFCFARGGESAAQPSADELRAAIRDIAERCGGPLLQLSGGEPTLRDDLPGLVRYAKDAGCSFVQLNTNGIRLAKDPDYAARLAEAGLDIVFLQFDGTDNSVYEYLRGAPLLETKLEAIRVCGELRVGVTLVPTVVPGVNDGELGRIIALAASLSPAVRGVHFQPVSYFGRYPEMPGGGERYTLDRLMRDISDQAGIDPDSFMPSRCDHPLCGFHADYLIEPSGELSPLTSITRAPFSRSRAKENREYVAKHWRRADGEESEKSTSSDTDFDIFLRSIRTRRLTLSAMAFQDAMNLNIERLRRCSLHVYDGGKIKPFCSRYLS